VFVQHQELCQEKYQQNIGILPARELCAEAEIEPHKTCPREVSVLQKDKSSKMATTTICTEFEIGIKYVLLPCRVGGSWSGN
jgi:hypothetical protein